MAVEVAAVQRMRMDDLEHADIPEKFAEIIKGELFVMTPAGSRHNKVCLRIQSLFEHFCGAHSDLDYGGDNDGFLLRKDPVTLLSPDATLYRRRPLQEGTWLEFAPEVVVEVLSPSNHPAEMIYKRNTYFEVGTEQFWLVDPENRAVAFYFSGGRVVHVTGDERIPGEGIAAGMLIDLAEIFRPR